MRKLLATFLLTVCVNLSAHAQLAPSGDVPIPAPASSKQPNEAELQTHGHYINKGGQEVHSPAKSVDGKVPAGASAKCRDGSYSFSKNRRGTCSGHGGVDAWL